MLKQISYQTNRQALQRLLLVASLLGTASMVVAEEAAPPASTSVTSAPVVTVTNPPSTYGVHIGDVLSRTVVVDAPTAYTLADNALPKKGSKHDGIELVDVALQTKPQSDHTQYTLQFSYQVFSVSTYPSVLHLPTEKLTFTGATATTLEVPAWGFWFSPLVTGGTATAKKNLQPEFKTPLIDSRADQQRLGLFLTLLLASLAALLYINADGHWLPFMGGAFARAHRQLKRLAKSSRPKTAAEEKKALVYLHQAFNQHYGANIFARDVEEFVSLRPGFKGMQQEITQFFEASNQSLYDVKTRDSQQVITHLLQLSKQLRDCERGVA
jgi:mxaA protein